MGRRVVVALLAAIVGFIPLYLLREAAMPQGPRLLACSAANGDVVVPGGTIRWQFDRPLRPDPLPGGWIRPWGRGSWRWQNPQTLVFRAEALPRGCWVTVQVDPTRLVGLNGCRALAPATLRLAASHLRVLEVTAEPPEGDTLGTIRCQFSLPVVPAAVLAHAHCTSPIGMLPLRLPTGDAQATTTTVHLCVGRSHGPHRSLPLEQATLQLDAGLLPADGDCGMEEDLTRSVALDAPLRVEGVEPRWQGSALEIGLRCNRPCTAAALERVLHVAPPLPVLIGPGEGMAESGAFGTWSHALDGGGTDFTLSGPFVPGQRYAVVIQDAATSGVTTPRPDRLPVTMPDHGPSISFPVSVGYLGSHGARAVRLQAWNLRRVQVRAWRVYASELASWQLHGSWDLDRYARPEVETTIAVPAVRNVAQDIAIPLDALLPPAARGDGVYRLDARWENADTLVPPSREDAWASREDACVVSLSDLALQVRLGAHACTAWCGSLATGTAIPGAQVQVLSTKRQILGSGTCDGLGWATIALDVPGPGEAPALALVTTADGGAHGLSWLSLRGAALEDPTISGGGSPWHEEGWDAFLYSERGTYRPGEVAHLRALVRGHAAPAPPLPVRWHIHRPDGAVWRTMAGQLDAAGDVLLDWSVPADARLGPWRIALEMPGQAGEAASQLLEIQDIVPLHLRASATLGDGTHARLRAGDPVPLAISAAYRVGTPAPGLRVRLRARLDPASPPEVPGWTVTDAARTVEDVDHLVVTGTQLATPALATDASGRATTTLATTWIERLPPAIRSRPWRLSAQATLLEPGGRALSVVASPRVLDGGAALLGLRLGEPDAATGTVAIDATLLDPATGRRIPADTSLTCELYREEWTTQVVHTRHAWRYASQRELTRTATTAVAMHGGMSHATLTIAWLGSAVVRLHAPDGTVVSASCERSAVGDRWSDTIDRAHPDHCEVSVTPATVGPPGPTGAHPTAGAALQVTVRSPFTGTLLLTVETDHVVARRVQPLTQTATSLVIPGDPSWWPGVVVSATVVRPVIRGAPWRVHRAFGRAQVPLLDPTRVLGVRIDAPDQVRPGRTLPVTVGLSRWDGRPAAGAHATIAVVDEGILALTSFRTPDPLGAFAAAAGPAVALYDPYNDLMPEVDRAAPTSAPGGDLGARLGRFRPPLTAHRRLASWWSGGLVADAQGRLLAQVPLPPSGATTLRVMVVADLGSACGMASALVRMTTPVLVAAEWPRALAPGDRLLVPVTLQNTTRQAQQVQVHTAVAADEPLTAVGSAPPPIRLAPGATAVVRLAFTAAQRCGPAHPVIAAAWAGPTGADEARDEGDLVVRPPAASEIRGAEVLVTAGHPQAVVLPGGWLPGATTASVVFAPEPQWSMPEAFERLVTYPAGCSEQTVSRCLPLLAVPHLAFQIDPWRWNDGGRRDRLLAGIAHLLALQCADGGIGQWAGDRTSWDFGSAYAAAFLVQADQAGLGVPREPLDRLLRYCHGLIEHGDASTLATQALAADAVVQAGHGGTALLEEVSDAIDAAAAAAADAGDATAGSPDPSLWRARLMLARAWIHAHQPDRARVLVPAAIPTMGPAGPSQGSCADQALWVETLAGISPTSPQLVPLAHALADPRRWLSTRDVAAAVLAIAAVQALHPPAHPYRDATLMIDGHVVGATRSGGPLAWQGGQTPMVRAAIAGPADGSGVLRWLVCGVPLTPPPATAHGLRVERRLEAADGGPLPATLHAGDALRVELHVASDLPCDQVLVEDLLPGCLTVEAGAAAGEEPTADAGIGSSVDAPLPSAGARLSVYDDRTLLVGSCVPAVADCRLQVRYQARLTAAGTFLVPPLRARCMQDEAITGTGATTTLTVLP